MFNSFFMAGFESATGYNSRREWIDQIAATQHDRRVDDDYAMVKSIGIHAVRDAIRWPLVDRKGGYDFSSVEPFVEAARRHEIDVVWDLFHYGYPPGLDLFSPEFPERFADYCYMAARTIAKRSDGAPVSFTPINEPSYFAWAAGEAGLFAPHCLGLGFDLKVALCRAAIQGINAIWAAAPQARIINVDALCRVVPPPNPSEREQAEADYFNEKAVFESWDMLAGRMLPELGGSPKHLDVAGVNYYWTNQWQMDQVGTPLAHGDPRAFSLRQMLRWAHRRIGAPLILSETGHVEDMRPWWMVEMAREVEAVVKGGVPLLAVCLYPILGMPEWHEPEVWTRMGLWDLHPCDAEPAVLRRIPHPATQKAFKAARSLQCLNRPRPKPEPRALAVA